MNFHADTGALIDSAPHIAPPAAVRPASPARMILAIGAALSPLAHATELREAGLRCLCVPSPEQALAAAPSIRFDSIVVQAQRLDERSSVWLPRLRDAFGCPIVLATDEADELDELLALELGADVFLTGALTPTRLRAHLLRLIDRERATIGRARDAEPGAARAWAAVAAPLAFGRWQIDRARRWLTRDDTVVPLTECQTLLLGCLAEAQGRIVPRRQLLDVVNTSEELATRSIDVYVSRLRRRLERCSVTDILVLTVRGRGYALHLAGDVGAA